MSNLRPPRSSKSRARAIALVLIAALALTLLAPPAHAEKVSKAKDGAKAEKVTELVLKLKRPSENMDSVLDDYDLELVDTLVGSHGIVLVRIVGDDKVTDRLKKDRSRVDWVEPNVTMEIVDSTRYHAWPSNEVSRTDDAPTGTGLESLDLAGAHTRATGAGARVAILDTGFAVSAPFLAERVRGGFDFVAGDADAADEADGVDTDGDGLVDEAYGHGTHVAGIVAQVAPGAELLSYRVLDSDGQGNAFAIAEAINQAVTDDADVINLSFGVDRKSKVKVLEHALEEAHKSGVVIVAAAGNSGRNEKRYPAAHKGVLSVAALDAGVDDVAAWATYGSWVDVAAPGVAVASGLPDGGYGIWSGSSMAAPIVSAQAALLIEVKPDLKAKDVEKAIRSSARKMSKKGRIKHGAADLNASLARVDKD